MAQTVAADEGVPGQGRPQPAWLVGTTPEGTAYGFTDTGVGNLGLHVGEDPDGVQRNRRLLEQAMGIPARHLVFLEQVHGTDVVVAEEVPVPPAQADAGTERDLAPVADACLTTTGRPLAVMTADCLPVVLTTEDPLVYAVAHAGRAGLLGGVLPAVVAVLREHGAQTITAHVGPAVCSACYEVPKAMAEDAERLLPGVRSRTSWHTDSLDLAGAAMRQLEGLGVRPGSPEPSCTVEDHRWFSHRRAPGEGRIAGVVWYAGPQHPSTSERTRA